MNLYIKILLILMILYTFYNFYIDFSNTLKLGTFIEGNQNMGDVPPNNSAPQQPSDGSDWIGNNQKCSKLNVNSYSSCNKMCQDRGSSHSESSSFGENEKIYSCKCQDNFNCDDGVEAAGAAELDRLIKEGTAEAMADPELKSLTQNIFDKLKVSYNNALSKEQLKEFIRQIDTTNSPPEEIDEGARDIFNGFDFNKNDKLDFNEMLFISKALKENKNNEFKRIQNIFSPSFSNNNNNNNKYQTLANGNIVIPSSGECPNGCSMPAYDNTNCENTLHEGKSYRQCSWTSTNSKTDCGKCGAVLLPKNEYGYAKTRIGYSDVAGLEIIAKRIEKQRFESKKQVSKGEFFNIGKEFLKQHGELKGYNVPNNITVKEYTLLGKILFIYLTNKTKKNQSILKNYIDSLYLEHYLNNKCDDCENNAIKSIDKETQFTLEELKKRDAYAYTEGIIEAGSDNRLGGSNTQFKSRTAYTTDYRPLDPRKFPHPYNSLWDIL